MVCAGKQRESLCPLQEFNLGHLDCNLTLPLTTNLISLIKETNNRTKDDVLKPPGYVMHQQFNIQQLYALPTLYYVFCIYLRTNSDLCHLQYKLIGFYSRDEKCLQRGMDWVFKYLNSLCFVFKGIIQHNSMV